MSSFPISKRNLFNLLLHLYPIYQNNPSTFQLVLQCSNTVEVIQCQKFIGTYWYECEMLNHCTRCKNTVLYWQVANGSRHLQCMKGIFVMVIKIDEMGQTSEPNTMKPVSGSESRQSKNWLLQTGGCLIQVNVRLKGAVVITKLYFNR